MVDRRRIARTRISTPALVIANKGSLVWKCFVRDITSLGARLEFQDAPALPTAFNLTFDGKTLRRCHLKWRIANEVGVGRPRLVVLAAGLQALQTMIGSIERRIIAQHHSDEASKRLRSIPGIGIVGATAITTTVTDPKVFRSGRDFAAWIGIVPAGKVDRWQTETGADLETRRPIFATHSGGRSPCGVEAGTPPTGEVSVGHTTS